MALFKDWQDFADKKSAEPGAEQYWTQYFLRERDFYEKLLKGEAPKSGTVQALADHFGVDIIEMTGYLDGINESLKAENDLENMTAETEVSLDYEPEKLYYNMVGAKVNGRIVQFDYHLRNGDVVEVMTSKSAHGPSRDWVKIARSSNARSKIRQWFKKEKRDENIVNGRQSFESELKRTGVTLKELTNEENLPGVLKKLCFTSLDDMYAAIGYGGISALKVMGRLREDIQRIIHQHQTERQEEVPVADQPQIMRPAVPQRTRSEQGIVVEGLTNCLVKFSKCCTPVPGDDIVGFITRGYGISVHRADCPNADPARRKPNEAGRWIKVSWGSDTKESYRTTLEITAKDRINIIMDVSTVLSSTKTHVSSMNARSTPDGFALLSLDIDVADSEQLRSVMRRIEQISGVMRVTRPAG